MPTYRSPLGITIIILTLLAFSEAISALSLQALGLNRTAYPGDYFVLLQQGFYAEVIFAVLVMLPVVLLIMGYIKPGISRYLTLISLGVIAVLVVIFTLGILIFEAAYDEVLSLNTLVPFLWDLRNDPVTCFHFFISEGISALIILLLTGFFTFERIRPANKVLGNAHFATGLEIRKDGFLSKHEESIIIGKKYGVPLYSSGFEHVLVFAPAGSGKTRSIAIPNLFNYPSSIVCNDVKFTLFETTSGYRERVLGHRCYCWALANSEGVTHRFNPLASISKDKLHRMTDIQRIAHILMPDSNKEASFWAQSSRKLFKALVLYLLDTPDRPTTLGEINRLIKQQDFDGWFTKVLEETDCYDAEFYRNGFSYIGVHFETRSNILQSFSGYFELFDDPVIDSATSASDFDLRDLRREKITVYVGFTDEDMERLSPILTLFWQQLISFMIKEIPDETKEPYPLLCLIDEFSSLGRIERLRRSLKLLREYRVRCILMFQYIAQTYERYSHDEARAFTNIKTKIAYTSEDLNDAEFISKMLGTRTKRVVSRSVSSQSGGGVNDSKNTGYQAIPLLRPEDVMKLKSHIALIVRSGSSPIKAQQYIWYKEASMKDLPLAPSFIPKYVIKQEPFEKSKQPVKKLTSNMKNQVVEECEDELDWVDG